MTGTTTTGAVEVWAVVRQGAGPVLVGFPPSLAASVEEAEALAAGWPAGRYECCTAAGECLAVLLVAPGGQVCRTALEEGEEDAVAA